MIELNLKADYSFADLKQKKKKKKNIYICIYTHTYIHTYIYILKSLKNENLPFLCFCATRLTAVAALQA